MVDGQNIVVDQLVKIIQAIQIGRTTGSLIATRGEGATYEVGTIVFVKGRVVQAKAGRREDRDALNWLSTWGKCRYTFVLSVTSESGTEGVKEEEKVPLAPIRETGQDMQEGEGRRGMTGSGNMGPVGGGRQTPATMNQAVPYRSKPLTYGLHVVEDKGMSRTHRHLFLLVNGERSIGDFRRLLQLDEYEVLALLYDLQDAGIISIPAPLSF